MKSDAKNSSPDFTDLRRQAEERLKKKATHPEELTPVEAARLIHELQVHQIELELQNEELRQAQVQLAESRDKYTDLYDFAPVGYLTLGKAGKILEANLTAATMLGLERSKLLGLFFPHFLVDTDRRVFRQLLNNGSDLRERRGEFHLQDGNGKARVLLLDILLLQDAEGREQHRVALTDITELKTAQEELRLHKEELEELVAERTTELLEVNEELREANDNLRALFEAAPLAIGVFDAEGKVVSVNPASERLFGWSQEEFKGHLPLSMPTKAPEEARAPLERALQGRSFTGTEVKQQRKDGALIAVSLSAAPLHDAAGRFRGFIGLAEDITERKRAEEAVRTQARVLESMAEAVTVTDSRGHIQYTNPAFDAVFGYEPGELLGRHTNILNFYPPEENRRVVQEILRQLQASGVWSGEFLNRRKDGRSFFTSARISALEVGGEKLFISVQEDITERRQREEMLRRQSELLDLAEDAILVWDMVGRVTYWNRGAEDLYGWPREEAMGQVVHRLLATEFPEPLVDIETRLLEQGRWEGESIHTTRDGSRLIAKSRWSLKRDDKGRPLAILEINNDITARRQAEEALRKSEWRFHRLVEANIIGMAVCDEETIVEANDAFLQMLGYTRGEMQPGELNWVELTPHEYLSLDAQALYELRTTGVHTPFEKAFVRQDGSQVAVMVGGALLEEDPFMWVSFVLDVSERKQLEAELRQSEARFRAIFSNASIGIATTDLKGRFQQFNAPVIKGLGYTPTELRGMSFFEVTHPEDLDKDAGLFAELAAGRRERYQVEKRYIRKDGRVLWGRLHVSLARNLAGEPEFAVSLVEDITARQEAQAALAESEARYRSLVEMSPDAIVVHAKGRIIFANQAGLTLFGAASPEDILGQHIFDLVHPDFLDIVKRRVKRGYAGEPADLREIKLRRFDGQFTDVESAARPITYQGQPAVQVVVRDISERKQAEEEIRRLANFPLLNPNPVIEVDEAGTVVYANPAALHAAQKLRLPHGVEAFVPRNLKEIFTAARTGGPREFSFDLDLKGAIYAVTLHLPHDLPTARLYALDITDRTRAEEALRESEGRERARAAELQALLDTTPGIILLAHDPEGRVITGNRAAYELMRRTPDSNLSKSASAGERPENFRTMQNGREITGAELPVQRAATGETVRDYDIDLVFDDGTVHTILGDAVPLLDEAGQPRGAVAAFLDITERKRTEEALIRSQAELEAIFHSMSDGVIFADLQRRIVLVNPAAEALFGYALEEMQGRTTEFIYASPADYEEQGRRRYHTKPDHPLPVYEMEYRRKDGSVFSAETKGSQVKDDQGRVIGFVSIHRDITERKRAEEELARQRELLQAIIDNIPVMLTFYDPNLKIFRFNKESRRVLGWSEEDLAAMDDPLEFFYPNPEQREQVREYMHYLVPGWRDFQATARDGSLVDSTWANIRLTDDTHIGIGVDIRERKRAEEALQRQDKLTQGINLVLHEALTCETQEDLGRTCLAVAEELSGSRFGFIGQINEAGLLDDIAISDPGWEACTVPGSEEMVLPKGWHFHGIYGQVIREGQSLIANDPAAHPDSIGLPEGHPPLTAFLGVPLKQGDKTIGMVGLGNKPGGYTPADQDAVETLSLAMVEALQRQRSEEALRRAHADLEERVAERTAALSQANEQLLGEIKERQEMEVRLRESEARFAAFMEHLPGLAVMRDMEGRYLFANQAWEKMLNLAPGAWAGKTPTQIWPRKQAKIFQKLDFQVISSGEPMEQVEKLKLADGRHYLLTHRFPINDASGLPFMVGTIAIDVTARQQAEEDLKISEKRLRYLAEQLLTAQEDERRRLASELHDELGHALLAFRLSLSSIAKDLLPEQESIREELLELQAVISEVLGEIRRLYHDLSPGDVEDLGLTKALQSLVENFASHQGHITWQVDLPELDRLFSLPVQTIIYRIVQEALTNIGKHAQAQQVSITAAKKGAKVHFAIQDNGQGFDVARVIRMPGRGVGLAAMEERLNMVGGTFEIHSREQEGTRLRFTIPTLPEREKPWRRFIT
ncbi:MAG: PAS domain S-box protein [Syntrophobacterales bacterium]